MKAVKIIIGTIIGLIVVMLIAAIVIIPRLDLPQGEVNIEVGEIELDNVDDGTYTGACDAGLVKVEVTVDVKDHAITKITIDKHDKGLGKKAEKIVDSIIENQSLEVDVVSGATISSDAIRSAIANALQ